MPGGGHRALHDMMKSPFLLVDPGDGGTIYVDRWGAVAPIVTAGASETRILAAPTKAGVMATVVHDFDGGDFTLTVNPASGTCYGYNQDNETTIDFDDAGDYVVFTSVKIGSEYAWRAIAQEGTTATVEDLTVDNLTADTATITNPKHVVTAVTAVGSVQSLATNSLAPGFNVIKGGGTNLGVSLPTAAAGLEVIVKNNSGSTALIYGASSAVKINALSTTTGFSVATTKTTRLICENSTQWWTDPLAVA